MNAVIVVILGMVLIFLGASRRWKEVWKALKGK